MDGFPDLCSGSETDDDPVEEDYGTQFVRFITGLLLVRCINAKQFCLIMWFAFHAGVETARRYKLRPAAKSGHYTRKVRTSLGLYCDDGTYKFKLAGRMSKKLGRLKVDAHAFPMHEAMQEGIQNDKKLLPKLAELVENRELPECYFQHPVVQRHFGTRPVIPYGIFTDGVPYSLTDSVCGFWLVNMVSGERHLCLTLRKRTCCKCGCRGRCTFWGCLRFICWCVEAMAEGMNPTHRHDLLDWATDLDKHRARDAGKVLDAVGAVLYLKTDWMDCVTSHGLPSWTDALRPCFKCNADVAGLYDIRNFGVASFPHRLNRDSDYEDSCTRCEHLVVLSCGTTGY